MNTEGTMMRSRASLASIGKLLLALVVGGGLVWGWWVAAEWQSQRAWERWGRSGIGIE